MLLARAAHAIHDLDYRGRFVLLHNNNLDTLDIRHRVDQGKELEQVILLTGQQKETSFQTDTEHDQQIIKESYRFASLFPLNWTELKQHYSLQLGERVKIAERSAREIIIEPKDNLRYGYKLSIDEETSLPLQTITMDQDQNTITRLMFTRIDISECDSMERGQDSLRPARSNNQDEADSYVNMKPPKWKFIHLPRGFSVNLYRTRGAQDGQQSEHFVFSDGLASVSVYLEAPRKNNILVGHSQIGDTNLYGRKIGQHQAIVIGNVPAKTLELFTDALVPVQDAIESND